LGKAAETLLDSKTFRVFEEVQVSALHAVKGFDPWTIGRRYLCAAELGSTVPDLVESDCVDPPEPSWLSNDLRFSFDLGLGAPSHSPPFARVEVPDPEPAVGHWARDWSVLYRPLIAALDVAWHLVSHGSVGASIFAIAQFVLGLALVLMLDHNRE